MAQRHIYSNGRHQFYINGIISLTVEDPGYESSFLFIKLWPGDVAAKFLLFSITKSPIVEIDIIHHYHFHLPAACFELLPSLLHAESVDHLHCPSAE